MTLGTARAFSLTVDRIRLGALAAIIVVGTFVSYVPAMRGGFVWDDDDYVTNNDTLRSADGLRRIWIPGETTQYYPVVYTTFWVEYQLWKLHPTGYHVVNVFLHAMGSLLLWVVLRRLGVRGAWLAALIFALHPVHVESVAWITERKNVLSGVLVMLSLLAYLRFEPCITGSKSDRRSWWNYGFSQALFVCALLAKTVVCTFPAVICLILWWKRQLRFRKAVPLLPMFVVGAVAATLTAAMESNQVGASGAEWSLSLLERVLLAGRVLWFYVEKLLWPLNVNLVYYRWDVDAAVWWQYLFPITAIGVLGAMWLLRERISRAPLVAALFFAGTLAPALGFFNVYFMRYSYVADHFQYLASIGPITGIAYLLTKRSKVESGRSKVGPVLRPSTLDLPPSTFHLRLLTFDLLVGCLVVGLATLTWNQGKAYENVETLWRDTLRKNENAWIAHGNLGNILMRQGKIDEAERHFVRALQLKQDFAEAHLGLGMVLAERGRFDEAIDQFRERLRLKHASPTALSNLGMALAQTGQATKAAEQFTAALRVDPNYGDAHFGLGLLLAKQGRWNEAGQHFRSALRSDPRNVDARYSLGVLLAKQGRFEEASRAFLDTLQIAPNHSDARRALQSLQATSPSGTLP